MTDVKKWIGDIRRTPPPELWNEIERRAHVRTNAPKRLSRPVLAAAILATTTLVLGATLYGLGQFGSDVPHVPRPGPTGASPSLPTQASTPSEMPPEGAERLVGYVDVFQDTWQLWASDHGSTRCQRLAPVEEPSPRTCFDGDLTTLPDVHLAEVRNYGPVLAYGAAPASTSFVEVATQDELETFEGAVLPPPSTMEASYVFYVIPLGGGGPGTLRFIDDAATEIASVTLEWDEGGQRGDRIMSAIRADDVFASGLDPVAGRWWLYAERASYGPVLHVRERQWGSGIELKSLNGRVIGDRLIGSVGGNTLLLVHVMDEGVARVELKLDDGTTVQGSLHPLPSSLIGPAQVFVAGFHGHLTAEGTQLDPNGVVVTYDASGSETGRKRLIG